MNLQYLRYATEIASTASMTKAAENLFTSQPTLSRAMRELESDVGILIFKRTPKGVFPTKEGEEFLNYARKLLQQIDSLEARYRSGGRGGRSFSISVPRASYISSAFSAFVQKLGDQSGLELYYKETNSLRTVSNLLNADYHLGILRYQTDYQKYFDEMQKQNALSSKVLTEFRMKLLFSKHHPLAGKKNISLSDLAPFTELASPDPFVPSLPMEVVRKSETIGSAKNRINLYERSSELQLLAEVPGAFMWTSPVPKDMLALFNLTEHDCPENTNLYRDVLIYKKDYTFSALDAAFLNELEAEIQAFSIE